MSKVLSAFVTGFIALLAITCIINLFFGEAWVAVLCGAEAGIGIGPTRSTTSTRARTSPDTLAWGGFLGGDYYHDSRAADAACLALLG